MARMNPSPIPCRRFVAAVSSPFGREIHSLTRPPLPGFTDLPGHPPPPPSQPAFREAGDLFALLKAENLGLGGQVNEGDAGADFQARGQFVLANKASLGAGFAYQDLGLFLH